MRGLDPRIHRKKRFIKGWIAGSSPAMTVDGALSTAADRAHPSNSSSLPAASAARVVSSETRPQIARGLLELGGKRCRGIVFPPPPAHPGGPAGHHPIR